MIALQKLRAEIAEVKSAHPFKKAAVAERALDAAVECIAALDQRILKLEEGQKREN